MMLKLLSAWKKRCRSGQQVNWWKLRPDLNMNLYQMKQEDRIMLRSFSVVKLLKVFGGENEMERLTEKVNQAATLLKKLLSLLVGRCLPMSLPFPVMSNILSHLLRGEGLHKVGFVGKKKEKKGEFEAEELSEFRDMMILTVNIEHLYILMRD